MMDTPMLCEWVVGSYSGERARSVEAHANAGIGYFIIDSFGKGVGREIVAVFRRPCDSPTPEHLQVVTDPMKLQKYEKMLESRMGFVSYKPTKASNETIKTVREIFDKRLKAKVKKED